MTRGAMLVGADRLAPGAHAKLGERIGADRQESSEQAK